MSSYLVRIELHQPTVTDAYDRLHEIMEKAGYSRTIKKDGDDYHLPDAEYLGTSTLNVVSVRDAVVALAKQVPADDSPGVFVVPLSEYAWSGLKKVESDSSPDLATLIREAMAKK